MKAFRLFLFVFALATFSTGCSSVNGERAVDRSRQSPAAQSAQLASTEAGWTVVIPGDNL